MTGFFYRDLCELRRHSGILLLLAALCVGQRLRNDSPAMLIFLPFFCILLCSNRLMEAEERSGWMRFAAAVPDGRRKAVRSKYAVLLLSAGGVLALELVLSALLAALGEQSLLFGVQLSLVCVALAFLVAEMALPAQYSFGYRDGAFFSVLMAALLLALSGWMAYRGMQRADWDVQGLNGMALFPAAAVLAFVPSYRASLSACEGKDF